MPEAPDAEHGEKITRFRAALLEGVERRNASAQDRRSLFGAQLLGDRNKPGTARKHHFGVAAIPGRADEGLIPAQFEPTLAALGAFIAMAAQPAYTDALVWFPDRRDGVAEGDDAADHFMAGHARWH